MSPPHWNRVALGDEVEILDSKRVPVNAKERADRVGSVPYYGATGQVGWIDEALFNEELVLLGEDGAPFFDRTRDVAYRIHGPAWVNNHAHVLRAGQRMTNRFLLHQLNQVDYRPFVSGTTRAKLPQGPMKEIPLFLPPIGEQHRIVAAIETHFSRLDAAVASLTRAKANVKRARASVLKAAVEGRLVPTEAALARAEDRPYEPASVLLDRILAERKAAWAASGARGRYQEPVKPETEGLPGLPAGWCWASIQQLSEARREPTYGVVKLGEVTEGGVPVLRSSNVRALALKLDYVKPVSPEIERQYARTRIMGGELLVTVRGTLGGVVVAPAACRGWNVSREVAVVALQQPGVGPFTAISFKSPIVEAWITQRLKGIAYTGLNIETLKLAPVPLPPLAEQHRIVAEVDRRLSVLDALDTTLDANLARCARLRQAILKRAFEGRLVPAEAPAVAPLLAAEPPPPHYALDPRS